MVQAHIFITGFVQDVGFRQFVKRIARDEMVYGWVRNLPEGRVEAVLQGPMDQVERVIKECQKGPFLAEVEDVEIEWEEVKNEMTTFDIRTMPS